VVQSLSKEKLHTRASRPRNARLPSLLKSLRVAPPAASRKGKLDVARRALVLGDELKGGEGFAGVWRTSKMREFASGEDFHHLCVESVGQGPCGAFIDLVRVVIALNSDDRTGTDARKMG
jgi:hypothetical protein